MSDKQDSIADPRDAIIRQQAETIQRQAELLVELQDKVEHLQALLEGKADAKSAKKPIFTENYSLNRNKRRKKKPRKKSTGRKPKQAKRDLATEEIEIYAESADLRELLGLGRAEGK